MIVIVLDGCSLVILQLSTKPSLLLTPSEISSRKFTFSLYLVFGHISDLALELPFSMANGVLADL